MESDHGLHGSRSSGKRDLGDLAAEVVRNALQGRCIGGLSNRYVNLKLVLPADCHGDMVCLDSAEARQFQDRLRRSLRTRLR